MEIRTSDVSRGTPRPKFSRLLSFEFLAALSTLGPLLSGCAAPGEPLERKPPVPLAVSDLSAAQVGNDVILTFTLPSETVDHRPLRGTPAVEIYRDFEDAPAPSGAPRAHLANPALIVTIPPAMVNRYADHGHIRYVDSLKPEDLAERTDRVAVYSVSTRASVKRASANSNLADLPVYSAPDPIEDLRAVVTHSGVDLTWTPPEKTPIGPASPIVGYHIYRAGPVAPGESPLPCDSASAPRGTGGDSGPLTRVGETESPSYRDTQVELGKTYVYRVRSVVEYPRETLESADSRACMLTVVDTTPPSAPQGLVVVLVPAHDQTPAHNELSWAISSETDVAGYNIYRSEQSGVLGSRLNDELLRTPAFRDMNGLPGHRYFYRVTAVDRSGNESPPSGEALSDGVRAGEQSTP
ncbi:MAG TPA: fibronectin type III domain-containing protein [Verrucomicrobiae bacterium]|nr:fibronectin type III domain-containing protein [Verrucomicrobiae bacterium]